MASVPRCGARLRDGQPCDRIAIDGSEFCVHHAKLAATRGDEVVKQGLPRRRNARHASEPVIVLVDGEADIAETSSSNGVIDPATVRPRLAEAAAEGLEGIRKTLLDAATGAVREHWVTFECSDCGKRKRVEVPVPDVRARVAAIELLLREGLGRPPQAEEIATPKLPANAGAVARMSWSDMQHLAALFAADEIESVLTQGGREAVRERLSEFSDSQRDVLSEALAELARA